MAAELDVTIPVEVYSRIDWNHTWFSRGYWHWTRVHDGLQPVKVTDAEILCKEGLCYKTRITIEEAT